MLKEATKLLRFSSVLNGSGNSIFYDYDGDTNVDDYILIITARESKFKGIAEKCLLDNDIYYDKIIYDTPRGERILINDRKPWDGGLDTAYSYNIDRNNFDL